MKVLETVIDHASDYIDLYDGSGYVASDYRPTIPQRFDITLETAPRDLHLVHKKRRIVMWRRREAAQHIVVAGRATAAEMTRPVASTYPVEGRVVDSLGLFNPRRFSLTAGAGGGHAVALYRSPLGSAFETAGGILGAIAYEDETLASWALLDVLVTPTVGAPINFRAQADAHGEFILPMNKLPQLNVAGTTYPAVLSVRTSGLSSDSIVDPENLTSVLVEEVENASSFVATVNFTVVPGVVNKISSKDKAKIVVRPS